MNGSNKLSDAEREALILLAEEAAEVVQCVAKILRHGPNATNPDNKKNPNRTNAQHLCKELGDMGAAVKICNAYGMAHTGMIEAARRKKLKTVGKYLHYVEAHAL